MLSESQSFSFYLLLMPINDRIQHPLYVCTLSTAWHFTSGNVFSHPALWYILLTPPLLVYVFLFSSFWWAFYKFSFLGYPDYMNKPLQCHLFPDDSHVSAANCGSLLQGWWSCAFWWMTTCHSVLTVQARMLVQQHKIADHHLPDGTRKYQPTSMTVQFCNGLN